MIKAGPPKCLTLFRIGCELCERGDVEAGQELLAKARELASLASGDSFTEGLIERIDSQMVAYAPLTE